MTLVHHLTPDTPRHQPPFTFYHPQFKLPISYRKLACNAKSLRLTRVAPPAPYSSSSSSSSPVFLLHVAPRYALRSLAAASSRLTGTHFPSGIHPSATPPHSGDGQRPRPGPGFGLADIQCSTIKAVWNLICHTPLTTTDPVGLHIFECLLMICESLG